MNKEELIKKYMELKAKQDEYTKKYRYHVIKDKMNNAVLYLLFVQTLITTLTAFYCSLAHSKDLFLESEMKKEFLIEVNEEDYLILGSGVESKFYFKNVDLDKYNESTKVVEVLSAFDSAYQNKQVGVPDYTIKTNIDGVETNIEFDVPTDGYVVEKYENIYSNLELSTKVIVGYMIYCFLLNKSILNTKKVEYEELKYGIDDIYNKVNKILETENIEHLYDKLEHKIKSDDIDYYLELEKLFNIAESTECLKKVNKRTKF